MRAGISAGRSRHRKSVPLFLTLPYPSLSSFGAPSHLLNPEISLRDTPPFVQISVLCLPPGYKYVEIHVRLEDGPKRSLISLSLFLSQRPNFFNDATPANEFRQWLVIAFAGTSSDFHQHRQTHKKTTSSFLPNPNDGGGHDGIFAQTSANGKEWEA